MVTHLGLDPFRRWSRGPLIGREKALTGSPGTDPNKDLASAPRTPADISRIVPIEVDPLINSATFEKNGNETSFPH